MATQRPRNRRLEQVADTHTIRRSPRLSGRFSAESRSVPRPYHVSSRQSLRGYGKGKKKEEVASTNILNESGQSVPASFDDEADGGAFEKREGAGVSPHLYGLDESDTESSTSSLPEYTVEHESSVPHTPIRGSYQQPKGILSQAASVVRSALYKCGSLIYLAATGVLCLDVIILHRFFNYGRPPQRGLCYYLFLPLILAAVILFLLGGSLIPTSPEPYLPGEVDIKTIMESVTSRVQKELNMFKASFRSDIQDHLENYVNLTIRASESKINLTVERELVQRDEAFSEYKKTSLSQLHALLADRTSALEARIEALHNASLESSIGEASIRDIAVDVASIITSVKPEWLAEAKQQLGSDINSSVDSLKEELLEILRNTKDNLTEKLAAVSDETSSLSNDLQAARDTLAGTTDDLSSIKTQLNTHETQIGTLQTKQQILDDIEQFKEAALERIRSLESKSEDAINADQAVAIFYEELDKTLANESSALRQWLAVHVVSADDFEKVNKSVNYLLERAPDGGLTRSDVEEVVRLALDRYSADRVGKFDFALENSGGSVILDKCSPTFTQSLSTITLFGLPLWRTCVTGSAKLIIQPQVYPGDCWAFNGTSGYATIKLKDKVLVTGVSVEHIPKSLAPNGTVDSAPRDFSVYGLSSVEDKGTSLGRFSYDSDRTPIQQFEVESSSTPYGFIRFSFENNYGNPAYTCVYRVRVHGRYPN